MADVREQEHKKGVEPPSHSIPLTILTTPRYMSIVNPPPLTPPPCGAAVG